MNIRDLKPYKKNAKKHNKEQGNTVKEGENKNDSCRNGIKNNELWRNKNTL